MIAINIPGCIFEIMILELSINKEKKKTMNYSKNRFEMRIFQYVVFTTGEFQSNAFS